MLLRVTWGRWVVFSEDSHHILNFHILNFAHFKLKLWVFKL